MQLLILSEVKSEDILVRLVDVLFKVYGIQARYLVDSSVVDEKAYNVRRNQYDATRIVEKFTRRLRRGEVDADIILLITEKDLYVDEFNFVFGYAPYPVGVVSLHRLDPRFYGENFDFELYLSRIVKEVVHEVGHLVGLKHCNDTSCVMRFSNTIIDTDQKGIFPCSRCLLEARENIKRLSSSNI